MALISHVACLEKKKDRPGGVDPNFFAKNVDSVNRFRAERQAARQFNESRRVSALR